ncbi:thiol reductant ABC exporter subunit CydC [Kineosporia succinea]|uniref:ATP-binding cassette subfamily C protein CydCD n=1 Tax=Kineosporia succinea TaxID=84632 RepID=A0ABT9P7J8_9ACTN|nr:thiol reductant ABC exporter subunit CydC [Kineosporia succinea]MDP9828666.1 ATP-binding cassette subfamily C protein CydCD [Kineosporia succinea]
MSTVEAPAVVRDDDVQAPVTPRPRGPVDTRVFALVPTLRGDAVVIGGVSALGALGLLGQLVSAAWAVTAFSRGDSAGPAVITFVVATLVRSALRAAENLLTARASGRAREALGAALVGAGLRMTPGRLAATGPGAVSALATGGVDTLEKYVTRYLPAVVPAVLLPPTVIVVLALLDLRSAVIVVVTLPLIPLFAALVGWLTERRSNEQWQLMSRLSAHFLDVVQGLVTLRAYRRAERQVETLAEVGERHRAATVRVLRIAFLSGTALDLVATLSVGLVAVEAGLRVAAGDLGLGTALLAILLAPEAYRPVRELGARFHESADASAVLDEASGLVDVVVAPAVTSGSLPSGVALLADGLTVRVPGRAEPVLSGVGLWVFTGQVTAIAGPSGVGKTTLLRVLAGQQVPEAGVVKGDAASVVYQPQRPTFPLARTLRDAVTAAWPDAPDAVVAQALRDAAADWVTDLDTPLAEDGRDLSAGQRQRLALARTLVQASRVDRGAVLLLDEPTAHLDDATEQAVLTGLRRRADAGAAVVTVAHRPAAVAAADEVTHLRATTSRTIAPSDGRPTPSDGLPRLVPSPRPRSAREATAADAWAGTDAGTDGGADAGTDAALSSADVSTSPTRGIPRTGADASLIDHPGSGTTHSAADNRPTRTVNETALPGFGRAWADARPTRSWIPARLRTATMNLAIVLGTLSSLSGVALTAVAAWLLTKASGQPPILTLTVAVVGVRLFAVTRPVLSYLDRLVAHDVALADLGRLRARVYADLIPRVPGPALPRRGDLLTRLVDDVDAVGDTVLRWKRPAVVAGATLATAIVIGSIIDSAAALAALPGLVVAALIAPAVAGAGADLRAERGAEAKAGYSQSVVEVLAGAEDVKALGAEGAGVGPVRAAARAVTAVDGAQVRRTALAEFLRMAGAGLAVAGVMIATTTASAGLSLEQVGVLVLGTLALADVTATLPDAVNARTRGLVARRRLTQVLESRPVSTDGAGTSTRDSTETTDSVESAPAVHLRDVRAGWDPAREPVLDGLDLTVASGRRIAVQGPSGCGKSTLAALVLKFLDPSGGSVLRNHVDYRDLTGDQVRSHVGLVSDDDHVFASSLRENLRLARPDATDGDLRVALTRARLGHWFNRTPQGLDTWLGERGATMSAGERRRLALARALLADRRVLVLDEPAESLDPETAQAVLTDVLEASAGTSVLLVTHRSEGLGMMDAVVRLRSGRLERP